MSYDKLHYRAKLRLEIGAHLGVARQIDIAISSVRANHDENGIPCCTVSVATGRKTSNLLNILGVSAIHTQADLIRLPSKAKVLLNVVRHTASGPVDQEWPEGWFVAFEGWVSNIAPSVSLGDRSVTLQLTHWLSDLDFSSPYSEDAYPTTPADFLFNAATVVGTNNQRVVVGGTAMSKAVGSFTASSITEDFWDNGYNAGLRPFFQAIATERLFNWRMVAAFTANPNVDSPSTSNTLMQSALARFEPFYDESLGVSTYEYGTPISLRSDLNGFGQIANRIRSQVCAAAYSPQFVGGTMWDRLIGGITGQYMFSIVPMVDRALAVPYTPWLSQAWAVLSGMDMDVIQYSMAVKRPVRAVAVVGSYGSFTGLHASRQPGGAEASRRRTMGYFEPRPSSFNASKNGMMMTVEAPMWINDLLMQGVSSFTAPRDVRLALAQNPGGGPGFIGPQLPNDPQRLADILGEKKASGESLANALAKATYLQQATQHRQMVISTNLRFDIAPGSTIIIQSSPDTILNAVMSQEGMSDEEAFVARVVRVSWNLEINGNSGVASTVYHLAYLRSLQENDDEAFAAADHPLWRNVWTGSPLIGLPEFRH